MTPSAPPLIGKKTDHRLLFRASNTQHTGGVLLSIIRPVKYPEMLQDNVCVFTGIIQRNQDQQSIDRRLGYSSGKAFRVRGLIKQTPSGPSSSFLQLCRHPG